MDILRANQIIESPNKVEVRYQGVPVWIDSINKETQTARVHTEANPNDEKTVPVRDLKEMTQD
jgi:small acid-soluble spore protein H (minor)